MAARVSLEEKKKRILDLFQKHHVFLLKDLERLAAKEKGINENQIKPIVEKLIDDNLIDMKKSGISTFYYTFASKPNMSKKRKLEETKDCHEAVNKKLKSIREFLGENSAKHEQTEKVNAKKINILDLQHERDMLTGAIRREQENDPAYLNKMQGIVENIKIAANRWTDNVFNILSFCKNKFNMDDETLQKNFRIPKDFDYL